MAIFHCEYTMLSINIFCIYVMVSENLILEFP